MSYFVATWQKYFSLTKGILSRITLDFRLSTEYCSMYFVYLQIGLPSLLVYSGSNNALPYSSSLLLTAYLLRSTNIIVLQTILTCFVCYVINEHSLIFYITQLSNMLQRCLALLPHAVIMIKS